MKNELEQLLIGKKIGTGMHRTTYECRLNHKWVVKIADDERMGRGANCLEYKIWQEIQYTSEAKRFAPCLDISEGGKYLLQERAELGRKKDYPAKIPAYFTDIKMSNFGFIGKNFVCVDYGSLLIWKEIGGKKLKKVIWD